MTRAIDRLEEIASGYEAIVFDQWGVLHDGTAPYPNAVSCLERLAAAGHRLAVLSNSGKRAAPNLVRIADMGFAASQFECVLTSGEALWQDIQSGLVSERLFWPIERAAGDARDWAEGLDIELTTELGSAEAILLMGLPDGSELETYQAHLATALAAGLQVFCTNPDRSSPRAHGLVTSPGTLAFDYQDQGGRVRFYGKPHEPVFLALSRRLGSSRLLMVGDSLEHDIAGTARAGWDSLLIQGGLYQAEFELGDPAAVLAKLMQDKNSPAPTYRMSNLQ